MNAEGSTQLPGQPVNLPDVEAELTAFWQGEAKKSKDEAITRTTTLNLIIIVEDESLFQRANQAVPQLAFHHPCRIILALLNPHIKSGKVEAALSVFCQLSLLSGKQICCEQINLQVPASARQDLAGAILPLLLPSLPVYLWWPNWYYFTAKEFPGLYQAIDRIILDIPATFSSTKALAGFADQAIRLSSDMRVSDMGWARITYWREAIAQLFDSPNNRASLQQLRKITTLQTKKNISSAAFLLSGWLVSSLDWKLPKQWKASNGEFRFRSPNGEETGWRIATKPEKNLDGLYAIELASDEKDQIRFMASLRQGGLLEIETWRSQTLLHKSAHSVPRQDDDRLLCNELDLLQTDEVYLQAIKAVKALLKGSLP